MTSSHDTTPVSILVICYPSIYKPNMYPLYLLNHNLHCLYATFIIAIVSTPPLPPFYIRHFYTNNIIIADLQLPSPSCLCFFCHPNTTFTILILPTIPLLSPFYLYHCYWLHHTTLPQLFHTGILIFICRTNTSFVTTPHNLLYFICNFSSI